MNEIVFYCYRTQCNQRQWNIMEQNDIAKTNVVLQNLRSTVRLNFPAFIIQFSFVACFFWLNAMCIEMWLLVRFYVGKCRNRENCKRTESRTLFFWYSLWCWGPSVILILVSMIMDLNPMIPATYVKNSGKESCSFKGKLSI